MLVLRVDLQWQGVKYRSYSTFADRDARVSSADHTEDEKVNNRRALGLYAQHRDRALEGKTDSWEQVEATILSSMTFAQEFPELWYLLFERPVPGFTPSEQSMDLSRAMFSTATSHVEEAMKSGEMVPGVPVEQVRDFVIAVMHGLAASHEANEPHLPVGTGRFGSLIPVAMQVLQAAWKPDHGSPLPTEPRVSEKARDQS